MFNACDLGRDFVDILSYTVWLSKYLPRRDCFGVSTNLLGVEDRSRYLRNQNTAGV